MLDYSFQKPIPVSGLRSLFAQTSWANTRSDAEIALVIEASNVQLGVWRGDHLVGYARALTDGRFRALIDDVVVDEAQRGSGIGSEMMQRLVARLAGVDEVFLLANDRNAGYYARLGFEPCKANCLVWPRPSS